MARIIGIRHRVKRTVEGEARPTMVAILEEGKESPKFLELEDETAELDFLMGRLPVSWRALGAEESLSQFLAHHVKWRALKKGESSEQFKRHHLRKVGRNKIEVACKVPSAYDGFKEGDRVFMALGGSGDRFAYALSRRGEKVGASVWRIAPFHLSKERGEAPKNDDPVLLLTLGQTKRNLFHQVGSRERKLIRVQEAHRARRDAQKDRIRCEQRLRQRAVGKIFLSEDGHYPEGTVEEAYDNARANDVILKSVEKEERVLEAELRREVAHLDIWRRLFKEIEGCGEVLAAGIITPIGDINRFETREKLKAFCGAHVLPGGRFARKRHGEVANWSPIARQALFLLADQWIKRPDSEWGRKLREYKVKFRERHPEVVVVDGGRKRYTDGHIHRMAIWRTITKFVEAMFKKWHAIDQQERAKAA